MKKATRKVGMSPLMLDVVKEMCWRWKTRPSPYIVGIIERIVEEPKGPGGLPVPPAGDTGASIHIDPDLWDTAKKVAAARGTTMHAMIWAAVQLDLTLENIPWDASTKRPQNAHIPIQE